jgi:hypothetical protein
VSSTIIWLLSRLMGTEDTALHVSGTVGLVADH